MVDVRAFRGVRYRAPGGLSPLICPPYDVITPAHAAQLLKRDPHNAIRLEMPTAEPGGDPYRRAAAILRRWLAAGVLAPDEKPLLYVLRQRFTGPDGGGRVRGGLLACVAPDESMNAVRPHELTHPTPKADRLALLRATHANVSPVFFLHRDPGGLIAAEITACRGTLGTATDDDGTTHELSALSAASTTRVLRAFAPRSLLIADGHHRYATALAYREERRSAGDDVADCLLAYLCSVDDPGLAVFPAHRLVKEVTEPTVAELLARLRPRFEVLSQTRSEMAAVEDLVARVASQQGCPSFALVLPRERTALLVRLRAGAAGAGSPELRDFPSELRALGVIVLHHVLLPLAVGVGADQSEKHIDYEPRPAKALARLEAGGYALGAFLAAPTVQQVDHAARAGLVMPQKATYFYPKVPSGLVFNVFDLHDGAGGGRARAATHPEAGP